MDQMRIENPAQTFLVSIHRIYTKNHRFELSDTTDDHELVVGEWNPQIQLQINPRYRLFKSGRYEVILATQITLMQSSKPLLQIYLEQAGLFTLSQSASKHQEPILFGVCANTLFPYVGAVVNALLAQAAFPPVYLAPLDFVTLYQRYVAQQQSKNRTEEKFTVSSCYTEKTLH